MLIGQSKSLYEPRVVNSANDLKWDDSADLVVVGFGAAGASTSIQARELGASVIAIDRFSGGGATAYSGGIVYAGDTKFQKEAGYEDSAEEMFKYLHAENSPLRPETLMRYCETSSDNIDWLESHGVPFGSTVFEGKTSYPPDGYYL